VSDVADDTFPQVAFAADQYLMTFNQPGADERREVLGVRLATSGEVLDSTPLLLSELDPAVSQELSEMSYQQSAVAGGEAGFGVFFAGSGSLRESGAPTQVVGFTSVPTSGSPVLPATLVDSQVSFSMVQTSITGVSAATSVGSRFTALYQRVTAATFFPLPIGQVDGADVVVRDGTVVADRTYVVFGAGVEEGVLHTAGPGTIASAGSAELAVWRETAIDGSRPAAPVVQGVSLRGALRRPAGTTPLSLVDGLDEQGGAAIGSDGATFLVAWSVGRLATAPPNEIRVLRYLPGDGSDPGTIDPPGGFLVADGPKAKSVVGVAHAAGTWLVTWLEEGILRGARLAPSEPFTATPFTIYPDPVSAAALTSDGERFLVVAERPTELGIEIIGQFVPATD